MGTAKDRRGHQLALASAKFTVRTDSAGEAQDSAWTQTRYFAGERSE